MTGPNLTTMIIALTGVGSGIGQAAAVLAAQAGAAGAVLCDIDGERLQQTVDQVRKLGLEVRPVVGSISEPGLPDEIVDVAVKTFGHLDGAINNAGIRGEVAPITGLSDADWLKVLDVNLTSVFRCLRAQLRHMTARGSGSIVNVASAAVNRPAKRMAAYTASKTGVVGLTRVAALEAGPLGVRVNAVCPGRTDTPMLGVDKVVEPSHRAWFTEGIPMGRVGAPSEIAQAAIWLLSDAASFVNGTTMTVDGGRSAG